MKKYLKKTAVILCGGRGTRLGSLGKLKAKTLVSVQGKEILWYIINQLKLNSFNHIILPLGFKGNQIKKFIKKNKNFGITIDTISTGINSSIGYRLFNILDKIQSDNFVLLNGDAIFDINIKKYFFDHTQNKNNITFLSGEIIYPYGTVGIKKGKICDFKRNIAYDAIKIRDKRGYTAYNYTGISIINKKLIQKLKNSFKNSANFEQSFFSKAIKFKNCRLIKIKGFWHSIDNIKDVEAVNKSNNLKNYKKVRNLKSLFINKS